MFNMFYSTLKHHITGQPSRQQSREPLQKLFSTSESILVQWITQLTIIGYSSTHKTVKEIAKVLRRKQFELNPEMIVGMPLEHNWVQNFLCRHIELKTVIGKTIKKSYIKGTSAEVLKKWFEAFEMKMIKDNDVLLKNVYNMNESNFFIDIINVTRVIVNT